MGDLKLKLQAIEEFDAKIVVPVLEALRKEKVNFAVLPDHPVPVKLRQHTTTPVPLAICGPDIKADEVQYFSEQLAPSGGLGLLSKDELIRKLLEA
jgi:2,3-bisphosphoglycerate-independent phosphoglycerate mutase